MSLDVRSVSVCAALVWLWVGCSAGAKTSGAGGSAGGGNATSSGGSSTGGTASGGSCGITECFRAVECVLGCGQQPVSVGCCPCTAPAFDSIACQGTGGTGSGGTSSGGSGGKSTGGSGGAVCGDSVCPTGQACACGGPGAVLQCACGDVCKTNADCGGDQPVCCGGVCTTACLCFCD